MSAFGPYWFNKIHWDNVAPKAAVEAAGETDVDPDHVEQIIAEVKPDLIITFGKLAEKAIGNSILADRIDFMCCHHPNARGYTMGDLGEFAIRVNEWVEAWKLRGPLSMHCEHGNPYLLCSACKSLTEEQVQKNVLKAIG